MIVLHSYTVAHLPSCPLGNAQLHSYTVSQLHCCTVIAFAYAEMLDLALCTAPSSIGSWTGYTTLTQLNWTLNCAAEPPLRFCVQIPIIVRHQPCTAGSASHLHSVLFMALLCRDLQHCSILALGLGWDTWGHEYPILTLRTGLLHSCTLALFHSCTEAAKFCQNCIASSQVLHLQYTGALCIVLQSSHESQNRAFIWLAPPSNAPVTSTLKAQIGVKIEDCGD